MHHSTGHLDTRLRMGGTWRPESTQRRKHSGKSLLGMALWSTASTLVGRPPENCQPCTESHTRWFDQSRQEHQGKWRRLHLNWIRRRTTCGTFQVSIGSCYRAGKQRPGRQCTGFCSIQLSIGLSGCTLSSCSMRPEINRYCMQMCIR